MGLPSSHCLAPWRVVRRPTCRMFPGPYWRRSSDSRRSRLFVIPECLILPSGPTYRYLYVSRGSDILLFPPQTDRPSSKCVIPNMVPARSGYRPRPGLIHRDLVWVWNCRLGGIHQKGQDRCRSNPHGHDVPHHVFVISRISSAGSAPPRSGRMGPWPLRNGGLPSATPKDRPDSRRGHHLLTLQLLETTGVVSSIRTTSGLWD